MTIKRQEIALPSLIVGVVGESVWMSGVRVFTIIVSMLWAPIVSAQVIECPGALPGANLKKEQVVRVAEKLLQRFTAALGLHGLKTPDDSVLIDEAAIREAYRDRPEQLLTKLTYLTLQCQMLLLDSTMNNDERRRAVRRVFLNYVKRPPDPDASSLAAYVNDVASNGKVPSENAEMNAEIEGIETALDGSLRHRWREQWFFDPRARRDGKPPRRWAVIVASPRFEDDGWTVMRDLQGRWPDVHFELDGPYDLESPHYAVVVGRSLGANTAAQLLKTIKAKGLPEDSYIWRAPPPSNENPS